MAIQFQYNKTYLQQLNRELRVRENALPTLAAKEAALRLEVHKARLEVQRLEQELASRTAALANTYPLWHELPESIITVSAVQVADKKIAGVKVPHLERVVFDVERYSLFSQPSWVPAGIERLRELAELSARIDLARKKMAVLEHARKKTTQKVNLYEKVQIPAYREAIVKIKRFLEDEESLAKSAQKILKARLAREEAA
ncbi:MAG: V-type ATP synthase subunit D [Proteobacteria bacterium]|nr:V-type ATP synthase subunit D [Pseudomonadota bacterium]